LERIGLGFRKAVADFAAEHDIPVVRFAKGERKVEVMRPYLERLERLGRTGVAAIGVAQEFQWVFTGTTHHADEGGGDVPRFGYAKADRRVTAYFFMWWTRRSGRRSSRSVLISPCATRRRVTEWR
jgi:hypothetical protein